MSSYYICCEDVQETALNTAATIRPYCLTPFLFLIVISIFRGTYHAQSLQSEALFYSRGLHNSWMEGCLPHLYLALVPHQAHLPLSQALVVLFHFITLIIQFTYKRFRSPPIAPTWMAVPLIMILIPIFFERCSQDLSLSFLESNLESRLKLKENCMKGSPSWLIVFLNNSWGIMLTWNLP